MDWRKRSVMCVGQAGRYGGIGTDSDSRRGAASLAA